MGERAPLRCDPLGSPAGLSPEWQTRLERLRAAVAGQRPLDLVAAHVIAARWLVPGAVVFEPPNLEALHRLAARFEDQFPAPFSRELAAVWAITNGILAGDDALLGAVERCDYVEVWLPAEERELEALWIGTGGYCQGRLVLTVTPDGELDGPVYDVDDHGEVRARYHDLGAFFDALLGAR